MLMPNERMAVDELVESDNLFLPLSKASSPALWTAFDNARDKIVQLTVELEVVRAQHRLLQDELEGRGELE